MPSTTAYARRARAAKPWIEPIVAVMTLALQCGRSCRSLRNLLPEVIDSQAQPLFEADARLPAQAAACTRVVQCDPIYVALSARPVLWLELVIREHRQLAKEVVDRHRHAGADMKDLSIATVQGGEVGGSRIADVEHVARLLAVAIDHHRLSFQHSAGEDRHHPA